MVARRQANSRTTVISKLRPRRSIRSASRQLRPSAERKQTPQKSAKVVLGRYLAFSGQWDEGTAFAEKAIKLMGPAAQRSWWWGPAKRHWFRGEYPEAYEAFQHSYTEELWLSHLDLAYTLPFLGRIDEAKEQVAALLKYIGHRQSVRRTPLQAFRAAWENMAVAYDRLVPEYVTPNCGVHSVILMLGRLALHSGR